MKSRGLGSTLVLALFPLAAGAANGLVAPTADSLWPQWKARISLLTSAAQPASLSRLTDSSGEQRSWQGGAVLGDYTFATPSFGSFRASGGLMFGATGGAPVLSAAAGSRVGLILQTTAVSSPASSDTAGTVPYLGLGFTRAILGSSLSMSADMGWVASRPSALGEVRRALFGNQGVEYAWRELRVSPVLQVGLRYSF